MKSIYLRVATPELIEEQVLLLRLYLDEKGHAYSEINAVPYWGKGIYIQMDSEEAARKLLKTKPFKRVPVAILNNSITISWLEGYFRTNSSTGDASVKSSHSELTKSFVRVKLLSSGEGFGLKKREIDSVFGKYAAEGGWDIPEVDGNINHLIPALGATQTVWNIFNMVDSLKGNFTDILCIGDVQVSRYNKRQLIQLPLQNVVRIRLQERYASMPDIVKQIDAHFDKYRLNSDWHVPLNDLLAMNADKHIGIVHDILRATTLLTGGGDYSPDVITDSFILGSYRIITGAEKVTAQKQELNSVTVEVSRADIRTYSQLTSVFGENTAIVDEYDTTARWNICKDFQFPENYIRNEAVVTLEDILTSLRKVTKAVAENGHVSLNGMTGKYGHTPEEDIIDATCLDLNIRPPKLTFIASVSFRGVSGALIFATDCKFISMDLTNVPLVGKGELIKFVNWICKKDVTYMNDNPSDEAKELLDKMKPLFRESLMGVKAEVEETLLKYNPPKSYAELDVADLPVLMYHSDVADMFCLTVSIALKDVTYLD